MSDRRRFLQRSGLAAGALIVPDLSQLPFADAAPGLPLPLPHALSTEPALPLVPDVDPRPLVVQVRRALAAAESLGDALGSEVPRSLATTLSSAEVSEAAMTAEAVQHVLDRACLVGVHINPEMRVKVARGPARALLVENGWRSFLVKVHNESGTTAELRARSEQARRVGAPLADRWLDLAMAGDESLTPVLNGLQLEYHVVRVYSHEAGWREATFAFDVGQGTQDLGFRNEVPILFDCRPAP